MELHGTIYFAAISKIFTLADNFKKNYRIGIIEMNIIYGILWANRSQTLQSLVYELWRLHIDKIHKNKTHSYNVVLFKWVLRNGVL